MKSNLNNLFLPASAGSRTAPNRLVAQAMEINAGETGGAVSSKIIDRYSELARGGWGIVFAEAISVTGESRARNHGLVLNNTNLDSFKRLVEAFKTHNNESLLMFQLTHSGRNSGNFSRRVKAVDDDNDAELLCDSELDRITEDFIKAVILAEKAGADGIDIKACHGYLGGELLRPANCREGCYGGSAENRTAMLTRIMRAAAEEVPHLVRGTRISLYEGIRGGCGTSGPAEIIEDLDDMMTILRLLREAGVQYFNISAGIPVQTPQLTRPEKHSSLNLLQHFRYCRIVREAFPDIPVIGSAYSAGREKGAEYADENIRKGYVDFAGFGRQNLADPFYPVKLKNASKDIRECILCGGCSKLLKEQKEVYCVYHNKKNAD